MAPEPPGERLQRRLGLLPQPDRSDDAPEPDDEADPNSLLPRWLPDGTAETGWLAKVRADPGRAGAIALAVIAALAVLITVFTALRDRPAPVLSAKLPPVEMVSTASPRIDDPAAGPAAPDARQLVVSVVGLVHKPGLATLAPGSRIADALTAAGGALDGADMIGLNLARPVVDGEQIVVGLAPLAGRPLLGSSVGAGSPAPEAAGASTAPAPPTPGGSARLDGGEPKLGPPHEPGGSARLDGGEPKLGPPHEPRGSARLDGGEPKLGPPPKPGEPVNLNTATVEQLDALPGVGPVTAAAIVAWRTAHGRFAGVDQLGDVDGIGPVRLEKLRALVRV